MTQHAIVIYPVDASKHSQILAILSEASVPTAGSQQAQFIHPDRSAIVKLTALQQEIAAALKSPALNERLLGVLEAHLNNYRTGGGHVNIEFIANYLVEHAYVSSGVDTTKFVKAAYQSFGKRLNRSLTVIPTKTGRDRTGEGVADELPLLAMFTMLKDDFGQTRHRFTPDAEVVVALMLGAKSSGLAASSLLEGEDPNETVGMLVEARVVALIDRVAKARGVSRDEALLQMTQQAGAG